MRRLTFNLNDWAFALHDCYLYETYDMIDDVVQRYKDFLSNARPEIQEASKNYLMRHFLIENDETIKSYVTACHKQLS